MKWPDYTHSPHVIKSVLTHHLEYPYQSINNAPLPPSLPLPYHHFQPNQTLTWAQWRSNEPWETTDLSPFHLPNRPSRTLPPSQSCGLGPVT
jgi:hypothetical protein